MRFLYALFLASFLPARTFAQERRCDPDVLFLNSYHQGFYWSDQILEGVRDSLQPHERLAVEYMDSKHRENRHADSLFGATLRIKYSACPPRIIVASDDYALRFLLRRRDDLFPGVPVAFCGANNFRPEILRGHRGFAGVDERNHMAETLALIRLLLPATRDVWFLTEASATGTGNRRLLDSLARRDGSGLRFHFFDSAGLPSWAEVERSIRAMGPGNAVYWSDFFRDRDGDYVDPERDLGRLAREVDVPFFAHQEAYALNGAVGGICNRGLEHGHQVGRLMRRILAGAKVDSIPIQEDASVAPVFHWEALRRFGVPLSALPDEAIVVGRPVPVWRAYPIQTGAAAVALILVLGLATFLLRAVLLGRRARRRLVESEDALRSSEGNLLRLFDALQDAVVVHDLEGRILFVNDPGRELCVAFSAGRPVRLAQEIFAAGLPPGDSFRAIWDRVAAQGMARLEWRVPNPVSGELRDIEISLTRLVQPEGIRLLARIRDVSDRLRAQRFLQRAKDELERRVDLRTRELVQANKELEAFAYSVSHDLRAPLRSMHGFATLLEEDAGPLLEPAHKDHLARIRGASVRMGTVIDDLLHLSRLQTATLQRAPVDMGALVAECRSALEGQYPEATWEIGPLAPARGDRNLLRPLWVNLLGNALKYSSRVASPRVEVGSRLDGEETVWWVRDNGTGFDMAHAHHLFQPFRRLHGPEEFAGNGIGLAIVQRVVTRHGGRVWAESKPGEGALFLFTLGA